MPGVLVAALMLNGCGGGSDEEGTPPRASASTDGGEWSSGPGPGAPTWDPSDGDGSDGSGNDGGGDKDEAFAWLPWGPKSPNTNIRIDSTVDVYDQLQAFECSDARSTVRQHSDRSKSWNLVSALALACLAANGDTAQWGEAVQLYDSLHGSGFTPGDCRETAAYRILKQVVDWHRQHPRGKIMLLRSSGGAAACKSEITEVAPGPEFVLPPGNFFTVRGTWPSEVTSADLAIEGVKVLTLEPREDKQCCADAAVVFPLPDSFEGAGLADLTLHFEGGGSLTKPGAISIGGSSSANPSSESPDPSPVSPSSSALS